RELEKMADIPQFIPWGRPKEPHKRSVQHADRLDPGRQAGKILMEHLLGKEAQALVSVAEQLLPSRFVPSVKAVKQPLDLRALVPAHDGALCRQEHWRLSCVEAAN